MSNGYFNCIIADVDPYGQYTKLLSCMHSIEFYAVMPIDNNRMEDGIALREYYCDVLGIDISREHISVLEVMLGIARRFSIEYAGIYSNWFWDMVSSLGLIEMTDWNYNNDLVVHCIFKFLNREYLPNGSGSLFTTSTQNIDMRDLEIWHQAMLYLIEKDFDQ